MVTTLPYRALARMGNVYYQQKQWKEAIKYFDKSLTEHRTAEVLKKKQNVRCVSCPALMPFKLMKSNAFFWGCVI